MQQWNEIIAKNKQNVLITFSVGLFFSIEAINHQR